MVLLSTVSIILAPVIVLINSIVIGVSAQNLRITNGNPANYDKDWSFLVWILITGERADGTYENLSCSGSLIADDIVLTAAHCAGHDYRIFHGFDNIQNIRPSNSYRVDKVITHEEFDALDPFRENDVMLMKLDRPVQGNYKLVELNNGSVQVKDDEYVEVAGWGKIRNQGTLFPNVLLETTVNSLSWDECKYYYIDEFRMNPRQVEGKALCVFSKISGPCHGDSGGPVMAINGFQIGVLSLNFDCAIDFPAVVVDVGYFFNWIMRSITLINAAPSGVPQTTTSNSPAPSIGSAQLNPGSQTSAPVGLAASNSSEETRRKGGSSTLAFVAVVLVVMVVCSYFGGKQYKMTA